ncbi:MAG: hypothetical protein PVJ15_00410 [Gammaproteobacteria bacterium]|jgi:hypothetical protein
MANMAGGADKPNLAKLRNEISNSFEDAARTTMMFAGLPMMIKLQASAISGPDDRSCPEQGNSGITVETTEHIIGAFRQGEGSQSR